MLGSMVVHRLSFEPEYEVISTYRSNSLREIIGFTGQEIFFDASDRLVENNIENLILEVKPDYIINCIGIIKPYCHESNRAGIEKAIKVNALFPHLLATKIAALSDSTKIIQIATDCVYDGLKGNYSHEDAHNPIDIYGKTKSLGEVRNFNMLNIRCSIIGPELKNKVSLLEWFLSNPDNAEVLGYDHHIWNGITTLQFAELGIEIINGNKFSEYMIADHTGNYVINETVTKFELLNIFNDVFNRRISIIRKTGQNGIDRSIKPSYNLGLQPMRKAIKDLKEYIDESDFYRHFNH